MVLRATSQREEFVEIPQMSGLSNKLNCQAPCQQLHISLAFSGARAENSFGDAVSEVPKGRTLV